jgi:hypothetical protein
MNCRLAAGEAACDSSKQLTGFVDYPLEEGEGNSTHFSDVVTYAVRTAKVTVSCEGEAEEHQESW